MDPSWAQAKDVEHVIAQMLYLIYIYLILYSLKICPIRCILICGCGVS